MARNVCFDLTRAFNRTRPTAILASGQAVVYYHLHPEQTERPGAFVEFVTSAPLPSLASEQWAP